MVLKVVKMVIELVERVLKVIKSVKACLDSQKIVFQDTEHETEGAL
jgi:hypothetical protein